MINGHVNGKQPGRLHAFDRWAPTHWEVPNVIFRDKSLVQDSKHRNWQKRPTLTHRWVLVLKSSFHAPQNSRPQYFILQSRRFFLPTIWSTFGWSPPHVVKTTTTQTSSPKNTTPKTSSNIIILMESSKNEISTPGVPHLQLLMGTKNLWGGMNETITLSQCALQRGVSYKVGSGEQSLDSEMAEVVVILEPVKPIIRDSFSHGPPNVF